MKYLKRNHVKIGFITLVLFSFTFTFIVGNYLLTLMFENDNELDGDRKLNIDNEPKCNLITTSWIDSAMGNRMFQYASLYGLAKVNDKKPFIRDHLEVLNKSFHLSILREDYDLSSFVSHKERGNMFYDENSTRLPCGENSTIEGFRQTYKYFEKFKAEIKAEFTFRDNVSTICNNVVDEVMKKSNSTLSRRNCFIVGAHIRRGDFLSELSKYSGFVVPDAGYILNATNYFEERFSKWYKCIHFLIVGNDYEWNLMNAPNKTNVFVLKTNEADVDLCILSRCNGSIVSTGTYGWWGAYLADGPTVYMKEQCRPKSKLCKLYNMPDYAGSDWDWTPL